MVLFGGESLRLGDASVLGRRLLASGSGGRLVVGVEMEEAELTSGVALLGRLRDELKEIEATDDKARKRVVIERYVRKIVVETRRVGPRKKDASVHVFLRLKPAAWIEANVTSGFTLWDRR